MPHWTSWLIAQTATNAPLTGTERPSALPYAVAAGMAIVLLLIVCMPSRKAQ